MAAVAADASAVPETVMSMPLRRPSRSTSGPTPNTTIAVPTEIAVDAATAVALDQPKSSWMPGRRVPKRMKS